ncbi:MAG: alpha/beta hydrolase [Aphanocapsa sp. GSE-SYN-MK-11-07L]|jgi:pimeloyl-ACP methyl ester carboxylesterase|nr:alpha/beta hydrolase [Aphanocapsa sp. GSE-SYN-MK-11-07L]
MAAIALFGVDHTYELAGTAQTALVFVHGWLLSRQYWQPLVQDLATDYQCLTYDLRGFAGSAALAGSARAYTPAAYAEDLALLLQHLQINQCWLVGHSLGGAIALWTAAQLPAQVQGVICLNAGGGIYLQAEFERFRTAGAWIVRSRPAWLANLPLMDWLFSRASVAQPVARHWGKQRLADLLVANPAAALGALLESTTQAEVEQLPQLVSDLQQPVYFLAGQQDPIMELRYVYHLASFHRLAKAGQPNVIELANCGHLGMIEQPKAIAAHIRTLV